MLSRERAVDAPPARGRSRQAARRPSAAARAILAGGTVGIAARPLPLARLGVVGPDVPGCPVGDGRAGRRQEPQRGVVGGLGRLGAARAADAAPPPPLMTQATGGG
jgi:hypothetical protein